MSTNLKIVIAEPSAIVRHGLETMLKRLPGLRIQVSEIAIFRLVLIGHHFIVFSKASIAGMKR